ncbi:alpha/beta hydrolase [Sphingomonas kyeonggiensis]|uniref:Acetyl esterase/lipase n=1 Tax=Sphingomonas kyeonggiensis TaxID=1268553 RepID=A0A7W6JSJ5_9SPHN|nr:alpha/beta hydrolase [Sphingomonas kyeonggiensis]MBB4098758.1 acetyl esterase/lipase [Sphingomonas kyeonggiensis]
MSDQEQGVAVQARRIPFPSSISPEARASLERLVGEDGVPLNALYTMPLPDDHAGWMAVKAAADGHYAAAVERLAGTLRSSVETIHAGDATIHVATPEAISKPDCAYLDFHGGALVVGGGAACRAQARMQADQHGARCYGVDYRMPPEHPYPAALDDAMAAYRHVLERHAPSRILVGGRSAGGNLAVAMLLRAKDEGLPLPAGLILLSPEVDLTESGDSFQVNQMVDVVLPGSLMRNNQLYAGGADLSHPYLSPLFGDLTGFPPTFLQSGTRDLFLSNAVRMHRALRQARVDAELHVFEAMPHGGFMGNTPEDLDLAQEVSRFARTQWGDV